MSRSHLISVVLVACLCGAPAWAYDGGTTHAGLTAAAATSSSLHRFLRGAMGLSKGLLEPLKLSRSAVDRRTYRRLTRKLERLDPSGGYRPAPDTTQRALGWLMAGSVLADMPSSANRNHFYSPALKRGLDNRRGLMTGLVGIAALFEGGDTVRQWLTGTGFDLTGVAAPTWAASADNPHSVTAFTAHLADAVSERDPKHRQHHLALALAALGATLHVLQDMASPTHVRDDFIGGHMQRLGQSVFYRGSSYERYVARTYGQFALPAYRGEPVRRPRVRDYFTSSRWDGLADITSLHHFSPGTLPPSILVVRDSDPAELTKRLASRLPLTRPRLLRLDLSCARRGRCHLQGKHGPLLAYAVDSKQQLRFFLDRRCHRSAARRLLPLAAGFSAGLVNHLLRGSAEIVRDGGKIKVTNRGARVEAGKVLLLWEDAKGARTRLKELTLGQHVAKGDALALFELDVPKGAKRLVALVRGTDRAGDPLVTAAQLELVASTTAAASSQPGPASSQPTE
jgi:hypothetical protein